MHFDDATILREDLLKKIGITEAEAKGMTGDDLKIKYGLMIYSKTLEYFPEYDKNPYMTREEFENVVIPFINK